MAEIVGILIELIVEIALISPKFVGWILLFLFSALACVGLYVLLGV